MTKITKTGLADALILAPDPHIDERGEFSRLYCKKELSLAMHNKDVVQINHSINHKKGVLRGMHFQYPPKDEIKIVKCIRGTVYDVIIDLRATSTTLLHWHGEILSEKDGKAIFIPEGFAHGFLTLTDGVEMLYFHTEYYSPEYEGSIRYDDPAIKIEWPFEPTSVSPKDNQLPYLKTDFRGL